MEINVTSVYEQTCKYYALVPPFICAVTFFYDAPFGRFALKDAYSWAKLDGIKSWIAMELVSPAAFIYAILLAPFASPSSGSFAEKVASAFSLGSSTSLPLVPPLSNLSNLSTRQSILVLLYLTHYANRALVSPLRNPGRSPSHISVVSSGVFFNIINGSLMGFYLSSAACGSFVSSISPLHFYGGLALWLAGFIGNVAHDEILMNIRRRQKSAASKKESSSHEEHHYAVPHGGLYSLISYPNYFCEWIEWTGFALASAPFLLANAHFFRLFSPTMSRDAFFASLADDSLGVLEAYMKLSPPWLFVFSEVWLMAPRAWRGHQWYKNKFSDYPKERAAVIPFIF